MCPAHFEFAGCPATTNLFFVGHFWLRKFNLLSTFEANGAKNVGIIRGLWRITNMNLRERSVRAQFRHPPDGILLFSVACALGVNSWAQIDTRGTHLSLIWIYRLAARVGHSWEQNINEFVKLACAGEANVHPIFYRYARLSFSIKTLLTQMEKNCQQRLRIFYDRRYILRHNGVIDRNSVYVCSIPSTWEATERPTTFAAMSSKHRLTRSFRTLSALLYIVSSIDHPHTKPK